MKPSSGKFKLYNVGLGKTFFHYQTMCGWSGNNRYNYFSVSHMLPSSAKLWNVQSIMIIFVEDILLWIKVQWWDYDLCFFSKAVSHKVKFFYWTTKVNVRHIHLEVRVCKKNVHTFCVCIVLLFLTFTVGGQIIPVNFKILPGSYLARYHGSLLFLDLFLKKCFLIQSCFSFFFFFFAVECDRWADSEKPFKHI